MDSPEQEDTDISSIRAEIRALQTRKRFLASSLLSSDALQKHLQTHVPATRTRRQTAPGQSQIADPSPLLQSANVHAQTNQHRIAFSTTTFPFRDRDAGKLLGVRIDVCARGGRFVKPYYVLLKRAGPEGQGEGQGEGDLKRLKVHRHTIPAFIPMQRLERVYLPLATGNGDENEDDPLKPWKNKPRPQNLASFIRVLRRSLTAWHLRQDVVVHLRERLGVRPSDPEDDDQGGDQGGKRAGEDKWMLPDNDIGLVSLGPTTLEARYIRLEWEDGRVGRFKVSDSGRVERAVVIGDRGRDKGLESVLTDGQGRVEDVVDRLSAV